MLYVGIDPGKTGAIVGLDAQNKAVFVVDFTDYATVTRTIDELTLSFKDYTWQAAIELVGSMPKQGIKGAFTFGENFGFWQGLLHGKRIPFMFVPPTKWQKTLGVNMRDSKRDYTELAQAQFPDIAFSTPRGRKLDGRAAAAWIAFYLHSNWKTK